MAEADSYWMQRALELAERGRGHVEPNPLVGAVLVRDGRLVGEGWHQRFGEAHAEVNALAASGEAARGATLYVTLEPCCHFGKTPPCTDAILRSGVTRVVAAMRDPYPQVAGRGAASLRGAGISVDMGIGESEACRLNAPYLKLLATGRPYVHVKWAMSLDGKIATRTGDSKWISGKASRHWVHALRGKMDAIVVGGGTTRADDPLLTVRPPGPRTPVRVVVCGAHSLSLGSQLVRTARETPVLVVCRQEARDRQALQVAGCEVIPVSGQDAAVVVEHLLDELGRRRMTNILVEGGSALLGSFRDAGAIDEAHVFIAPRLIGGANAFTPMAGQGVDKLTEAMELDSWDVEQIDGDFLVHARREKVWDGS